MEEESVPSYLLDLADVVLPPGLVVSIVSTLSKA